MDRSRVHPDYIHLRRVRLNKSSIEVNPTVDLEESLHGYTFSFHQRSHFYSDKQLFLLHLDVLLGGKDVYDNPLDVNCEFALEFLFEIDNLAELSKLDGKKGLMVDQSLGETLMAIAYSTSRGVILQATQTTVLGGVILPVIAPRDLLIPSPAEEE